MNFAANCFTIPTHAPFLRTLAEFCLREYGNDKQTFTKLLILLPNRRSCRALRESFLECSNGKPLLLPRIQPIGEVEDEALFFATNSDLAQPIDPIRRHFLLTRLVLAGNAGGSVAHALELARELASLMDEINREGLSFDGLSGLAPENLAGHWQQTLDFLTIISHEWPRCLAAEGAEDAIILRNKLLFSLAANWRESPPDFPIIAAGSIGRQPAAANLLKAIAHLPLGKVILPALDKEMLGDEWEEVGDTHPQYELKNLLKIMEIDREDVLLLSSTTASGMEKENIIRAVFAPPAVTAKWSKLNLLAQNDLEQNGLANVKLIEAETQLSEARTIAIALRQALEKPEKTAALITPDRTLARMVAAQMQRFGVIVDDSAGKPLAQSAPACFLRLTLEMVASRFAPAPLLAVLRHPLAAGGIATKDCRRLSRELEISSLRGIRRGEGIAGLIAAAKTEELAQFLTNLEKNSAALSALFAPHYNANLKDLLAAHISFAEWLADDGENNGGNSGAKRLWAGEAGNALAEIIAQWNLHADILLPFDALIYPALFESLLAPEIYRPQAGLHPRLHILGPMEARLQHFDLVILGGLNEGTWPKRSEADPWMSRPQRAELGLPNHGRIIGQSAHDVQMLLLSAPEILLTRAQKIDGSPTIPSRWLVRLQTLIGGRAPAVFAGMSQNAYFADAQNILEQPAVIQQLSSPAPTPSIACRPRALRVTAIDQWLRDPYSIYARYILNIKQLEELDREPNAADFGNLVHAALENFTNKYPSQLPENICNELLAAGRVAFADFLDRPAVSCLWWPRFESMVSWLAQQEKHRRALAASIHSEVKGSWKFAVNGNDFTLTTRIDRLELLTNGGYAVIDYKTGLVPSKSERERGISNQLPLEALVIKNGELSKELKIGDECEMQYWKLSGNEEKCDITIVEADLEETRARIENLITQFDNPHQAYTAQTDPTLIRYSEYEHLTRRKEWEVV